MWISLLFIGIAAVIALMELPTLVKQKQKREIKVFFVILTLATTLSILKAHHINLPNPLAGIITLYEPVKNAFFGLLF